MADLERKFIDLKALKVSDEGVGTIEGYRAVFAEIDEGGDLIVKGFFADSIPEYIESGFTAHSHSWTFSETVGFPVDAKEDDYGFFVKSQFHSTSDAQDIRKKAKERMDAGKKVGFSFGYSISDKSYIEAKDYKEQLPLYIKPERLAANLLKAQQFDRIRILKKGEVIEDSIVTAPMNKLAAATAIKSEARDCSDCFAKNIPCTHKESGYNCTRCGQHWDIKSADACLSHVCPTVVDQIKSLLAEHGVEQLISQMRAIEPDNDYLKGITGTESFESFESAGTALEKFAQKMRSNHEIRVKEGRVLSSSNRAKVQACRDSMVALMTDLDDLLAMSEPKPKEKEIDVDVLRTQSMRARNRAFEVLAQ